MRRSFAWFKRRLRSPAALLVAVILVSSALRTTVSISRAAPWILPDELLYADLARSVADGGAPAVRGVVSLGWGVVYPIVLAPAWLLDDPEIAHHVSLAIGAVVMSMAAIPVYLLARMFVTSAMALLSAVAAVLVPSMVYADAVLTESVGYPMFLVALWAMARSLQRSTIGAQVFALVAIAALVATRLQGIALGLAYFAAVLVSTASRDRSDRRSYLSAFLPSAVVVVGVTITAVIWSIAVGDGALGWLGGRSHTFDEVRLGAIPEWLAIQAGGLILYTAGIPVLATAILLGKGLMSRSASESQRLFAALAVPTVGITMLVVATVGASVEVEGIGNLNERYLFYFVPLFYVGMAVWAESGAPRPQPAAWVAVATCSLLAAAVPFDRLRYAAAFQSPGLLPWLVAPGGRVAVGLAGFALVLGGGWLWMRSQGRGVRMLWIVSLSWAAFVSVLAVGAHDHFSDREAESLHGQTPKWVDDVVGSGSTVVALWDQRQADPDRPDPLYRHLMLTEFFNPSISRVHRLGRATYYENVLPTSVVRMTPSRALIGADGVPIRADFVVTTCRTPIAGREIGKSFGGLLRVVEVDPPLRLLAMGSRCSAVVETSE